jgi:hypothetical protein
MLVHTALICGAAASRAMRTHFIELARHCIAESMDHTLPYWTPSPLFSYKRRRGAAGQGEIANGRDTIGERPLPNFKLRHYPRTKVLEERGVDVNSLPRAPFADSIEMLLPQIRTPGGGGGRSKDKKYPVQE